jgi:uncharacterized damage-inducible protein DinB
MSDLSQVIQSFARMAQSFSDADLERPWSWWVYDEGVRFAFFRSYEQLRQLATHIEVHRQREGQPVSLAQRILGQYHCGYRDLQAVLLGVDDGLAQQKPSEEEWSLRQTLPHIIQAEGSFFAITFYGLERQRSQDDRPLEMSDAYWEAFWEGDEFSTLKDSGAFSALLAYYDQLHSRVLNAFQEISAAELGAPTVFWEEKPMPVEFRLHRFDSHLRQHTVQMEKILAQVRGEPSEARRLLRLIYAALAEVESSSLGTEALVETLQQNLAEEIKQRSAEVSAALSD